MIKKDWRSRRLTVLDQEFFREVEQPEGMREEPREQQPAGQEWEKIGEQQSTGQEGEETET